MPEGADQSPKSGSSPSSPSFADTVTPFSSGSVSPRKTSTPEESFRPPRLPPKPPSVTSQPFHGVSKNSPQSRWSPTLGNNSDPPPIPYKPPARPKREPLSSTLSSNAPPLPPKPPSTTPQKVLNEGPPLPPRRESTPSIINIPVSCPTRSNGPPLPPKHEPVSLPQIDSPTVPPRNDTPVLPSRGPSDLSLNSPDSCQKTPLSPPPPVPPRGS